MRQLREFGDPGQAQRIADALHEQGVDCDVRVGDDQAASVWVHDELDMERAEQLTQKWLENEAELQAAAERGRQARRRQAAREQREQRQAERTERAFQAASGPRPTPLTLGLIGLCVAVYLFTEQGENRGVTSALWIADPRAIEIARISLGKLSFYWLSLPWREPWRLLTPIVVHADLLHIVFNMLWLQSLGSVIERRHGSRYLFAFIVVCGALSNIAQYEIGKSPAFVGMSGVVYGLLGMIWLRGRLDPRAGYALSTFTLQFMLLWLVLGFVMPNVNSANWCHLGGLVVGCAWGALAARRA